MNDSKNEKMPIWMLSLWIIGLVGLVVYFLSSLGRNPF